MGAGKGARRELMLEIGCEEIPARFIAGALDDLANAARKLLSSQRLEHGEVLTAGTPRRLALCVREVESEQPELVREVTGPAAAAAFGPDGKPTKAGIGFARSQGVEPEALKVKKLAKGEYVCATRREEGRPARAILKDELPGLISAMSFPKSMRWGEGELRFARPLHWMVALFGGEVLDFMVEGITAGNMSRGHRFLSPELFAVSDWADYIERCDQAFVVADPARRRESIREQIAAAAAAEGGEVEADEELLETVTNLVEYPVAVCGSFEEDFLRLPEEVLITSMKAHQKYFTVRDRDGRMMARFIAVSNMKCEDMGLIREGNERVLRARLSDAAFFFREDSRVPLGDIVPELEKVVYQEKIGTYREKAERVAHLAGYIAHQSGRADPGEVARAAMLCKADLVTQMVGEFPELQGVMGREYALLSGENESVATAVFEHYLPRFSGDELPGSDPGAILGIADRADAIAGIFGIGEAPTGSEDPFALRRQALAILSILAEREYAVDLTLIIEKAICNLQEKISAPSVELMREIMEFFRVRLENLYTGAGSPPDIVRAVLSAGFGRVPEVRRKIEALEDFRNEEGFIPLATAFKRAANIVPEGFSGSVDGALLREDRESELHRAVTGLQGSVEEHMRKGSYREALREIASIRPVLDGFFESVLVMAEEEELRENRLALVKSLVDLFASIADFRQITV